MGHCSKCSPCKNVVFGSATSRMKMSLKFCRFMGSGSKKSFSENSRRFSRSLNFLGKFEIVPQSSFVFPDNFWEFSLNSSHVAKISIVFLQRSVTFLSFANEFLLRWVLYPFLFDSRWRSHPSCVREPIQGGSYSDLHHIRNATTKRGPTVRLFRFPASIFGVEPYDEKIGGLSCLRSRIICALIFKIRALLFQFLITLNFEPVIFRRQCWCVFHLPFRRYHWNDIIWLNLRL